MARPSGARTLSRAAVLDAAADLIDERGPEGLTLAELAERLGVRPPSLYTHVGGLPDLLRELRLRALTALREGLEGAAVGRSDREALAAIAAAYKAFAAGHPGLYALTTRSSEGEDPQLQAAGAAIVAVAAAALRGYGLEGERAVHATRFLRSTLHGFASLEASGGFGLPVDLEESFALTVTMLDGALRTLAATV